MISLQNMGIRVSELIDSVLCCHVLVQMFENTEAVLLCHDLRCEVFKSRAVGNWASPASCYCPPDSSQEVTDD